MVSSSRDSITAAIAAEEARLAALDREREDIRSRLKQLGIELAALDVGAGREAPAPLCSLSSSLTSTEKVALFRSLFRGRDDVYPKLWENVKAKYVTGLTATLQRRDGHHPIIEMELGPVRFTIDSKNQTAGRPFAHRLIVRETQFRVAGDARQTPIQDLYRALVADASRNQLIVNDVLNALEEGRSPLLLTERKDHLEYLEAQLRPAARNLVVLRGGMGAKQRREVAERIAAIPPDEERLVLATGRYIGEGFDDARLDTLFLTLPVSWKGTLVQYAGRLHRLHEGKREVRIFDYVDREVPMLARMFEKRLRGYGTIGYEQRELPAGYEGVSDEPVIEWDEGALKTFNDPI